MKSFRTLNIKQVSAIHSRPLSNYRPTIHGVSNPTCALHSQGQYWAGKTPPPNNPPPNMAATNFVVITNGKGCALNGTAVTAVLINQ